LGCSGIQVFRYSSVQEDELDDGHTPMERMEVFLRYVEVADWAWNIVQNWPPLARDTVGKQLVRAADSVGANLVEGDARYTSADGLHFLIIARASARETRYWLQRAIKRGIIPQAEGDARIVLLTSATQLLNRLITYRRQNKTFKLKEDTSRYDSDYDPFSYVPENPTE
jgi:four helix bundle protein